LRRLSSVALYDGPAPEPLRKGEAAVDAVARLRMRGRELSADANRIESAPLHSRFAKERARAQVERLIETYGRAPAVGSLIENPHGEIGWQGRQFVDTVIAGRLVTASDPAPPALPLLLWLLRSTLIEAIEREIDAQADDEHALTSEERAEQLAVIWGDLLATERAEEFWLSQAVKEGASLSRRSDLDPRACLGFASSLPRP